VEEGVVGAVEERGEVDFNAEDEGGWFMGLLA
jgi:hypothetical protein